MPGVISQPPGKTVNYGIESISHLTWSGWEPGREYTKHIVLKNVRVKNQKLKYRVPKSCVFTTMYAQPIMLAAGNTFSLPVTFRPLEKVAYEDQIEFLTNEGCFCVAMKAELPQFEVELPDRVNVGMCAVKDTIRTRFEIHNRSELLTPFHIDGLSPFNVEPTDGQLQPFSSVAVVTIFHPQEATVYECQLVIRYGLDLSLTASVQLIGTGKYAHLVVPSATCSSNQEVLLSFGSVLVGHTVERSIDVTNMSPVNAPFTITQPMSTPCDQSVSEQRMLDQVFHCCQKTGVVCALKTLSIPISFTGKTAGITYVDYFYLQAKGCPSKTVVKCIAVCTGPCIVLSKGQINFHLVMFGEIGIKSFEIMNNSDADATFQFDVDTNQSVFKIEPVTGAVPAHSCQTVFVRFCPQQPMNYYRRVSCLVHNQGVLNLDLLGTCHTESEKPAVLQPIHIQRYQVYVDRGLSLIEPEVLNSMFAEGKLAVDGIGALYSGPLDVVTLERADAIDPIEEYFSDGHHTDLIMSASGVSLDVTHLSFGCVTTMNNVTQRTVCMTNHTNGKVSVNWSAGNDQMFMVCPLVCDIPPQCSSSFQVIFQPAVISCFYSAQLECFVQYKSLRDYCSTNDTTHFPPWCLTLTATASTFQPSHEVFLPKYSLDPYTMTLSVVSKHDAVYKTILLVNMGQTPIMFDCDRDIHGVFAIKPLSGVVESGQHQIFVMKFQPNDECTVHKNVFVLHLNGTEKYHKEITVYGSTESPQVKLDNYGVLYFKPTCINTSSTRQFGVHNISRLPVCFEWRIKHSDQMSFTVHPTSGVILPNEVQYHTWQFTPTCCEKYVIKPKLLTWSSRQPGSRHQDGKVMYSTMRAIGEGAIGHIKSEQTVIDVGCLVVGTVAYRHLTIVNDSLCNLYYKLHVKQSVTGPYGCDSQPCSKASGIALSCTEGMLPARSRTDVLLTILPLERVSYQWRISYTIHSSHKFDTLDFDDACQCLCDVLVTGVYPSFFVTDARCYGSAVGLSKKQLWTLFSIDNFNMFLDGDPSCSELTYSTPTRHSHERRPPIHTRASVEFNFSAAPVGSEPSGVQLCFENAGSVCCEWAFLLPSDQQLDLEFWAENGDFSSAELHELKVMDNKLFSIEPVRGVLGPGESCTVSLTYKHVMVGTDRLPVLLKVSHGREILLNFIGVTVEINRHYIHFASTRHMFAPVAIGEVRSPVQVYEMYNGGALPVSYEIDLSPLSTVFQENYSHAVFECLNPKGCIDPGQTAAIEWRFSPLEARTYMVDIAINIEQSETTIITFTGIGFDKRLMGSTMSSHSHTIIPCVQKCLLPGQLCYLSCDRLCLGNVPLLTCVRRLVVVTNTSKQHSVKYTWHVTSELHGQFVTVSPTSDTLNPEQTAVCTVKFYAVKQPAFYDIDLICETMNLSEYNEYEMKLHAWEMEQQRQLVEFTITDAGDSELTKLGSLHQATSTDSELSRYKTLPPIIKQCYSTGDLRGKHMTPREFEECFWSKPELPRPFLLHLGLTARTHDMSEYQTHFPEQLCRFFIDRSLSESPVTVSRYDESAEKWSIRCQQAEADMLNVILSNILRTLIDDSGFHEACRMVFSEDIPYFKQFSTAGFLPATCRADAMSSQCSANSIDESQNEPVSTTNISAADDVSTASSVPSFHMPSEPQLTSSQQHIISVADAQVDENNFATKQFIKKLPEFGKFAESCLENTVVNIIHEAFKHEFNITARPRLVALPP